MARVQWHGTDFYAEPLEELPGGKWKMRAKSHHPRCSPGTVIIVAQDEILEMAAAEAPPTAESSAALEAAMAEERKMLPTFAEIHARNQAAKGQPNG